MGLELANFELDLVFLRFSNVWRIGNHKIECIGFEPLQQIGFMELNPAIELMSRGVGAGDFQGIGGNVCRMDVGLWEFFGENQGNAA